MTDPRGPSPGDLFADALEVPAEEREAWLDANCPSDPKLRSEVESLLAAHGEAADFLAYPALDTGLSGDGAMELEDLSGRRVGAYRLVRVLGRGGMSSVYLAERADGDFEQRVAVKLIKPGMDSDLILGRFRTERRVLAALEHPNIARLIDGGATEEGRPFLVMEYVDGLPIDRYCRENDLTTPERVELFRAVCEAVQHAHGRLVVHRDLKPSNILVSKSGGVKLLDFGIAKVLQPAGDPEAAGLTVTSLRMMTPRYASPEQVRGEAVTTATDVYSLGVLLYELLTGKPPYEITRSSPAEAERIICGTTPARPSTMIPPHGQLARSLSRDLDNIVLKALSKEPDRRYSSVEGLADDLRRQLAGLPVSARRDTLGYRTGKFLRRHRVSVTAATLLLLSLLASTAVSTRLYLRSERALEEADRQRRTASRVSDFLQSMMLTVDPVVMQSSEPITVNRILEEAAERIETELADEPEVAAALHETIAATYLNLGDPDGALPHGRARLELRATLQGRSSVQAIQAAMQLGRIHYRRGEVDEAEDLFREVLGAAQAIDEGRSGLTADALRAIARIKDRAGDYEAAKWLIRQVIALRQELGAEHLDALASDLNDLGLVLVRSGEPDSAVVVLREAQSTMRMGLEEDHSFIAQIDNNIGWALTESGNWEPAVVHFERAIERYSGILEIDHPSVIAARANLARCRQLSGDLEEAERIHREVIAHSRSRFGNAHPNVAHVLNNFAMMVQEEMKDYPQAVELYREARDIYRESVGEEHPWVAIARHNGARALRQAGEMDEAESECRGTLDLRRRVLRPGHPDIARSELLMGKILMDRGRAGAAEPHLEEAMIIRRAAFDPGHGATATAELWFGLCLVELGRKDEARIHLENARRDMEAKQGADSPGVRRASEALAALER